MDTEAIATVTIDDDEPLKNSENGVARAEHLFKLAKQLDYIDGPIQTITFSDPYLPAEFRLIEVENKLAEQLLTGEEELTIRGRSSDLMVACTSSKTFLLKEVESSSTNVLLTPQLGASKKTPSGNNLEAICASNIYLEMTEVGEALPTTTQRLRELLSRSEWDFYSGDPEESGESVFTWKQLLGEVQLSEAQLRCELRKFPVVELHGGSIKLLSEEARSKLLDQVMELCDKRDIPLITVSSISLPLLKATIHEEGGVPLEVIEQWLLPKLCIPNSPPLDGGKSGRSAVKNGIFSLNGEAVCRERLSNLFHSSKKLNSSRDNSIPLVQLEKALDPLLPVGITFQRDYLRGLALLEENIVTGTMVRPLCAADLPLNIEARFDKLFSIRSAWSKVDLEPYLAEFCQTSGKMEETLLKCCKMVKNTGGNGKAEVLFSRKQH